jgi:hypothetical protein
MVSSATLPSVASACGVLREKARICVYNTLAVHGDEWPLGSADFHTGRGYGGMCPQFKFEFPAACSAG